MPNAFEALRKYIPDGTFELVEPHLEKHKVFLKVTKPRSSKLGDYRPPHRKGEQHRISVNGNMNSFAFLITLVHELAHLYNFNAYGRKVKPHGAEWKSYFKQLLQPYIELNVFPENVQTALDSYIQNPAASSCTDQKLFLALEFHNPNNHEATRVADIAIGEQFIYKERLFRLDHKLRTRYHCTELSTKKKYFFSALAQVNPVYDKN